MSAARSMPLAMNNSASISPPPLPLLKKRSDSMSDSNSSVKHSQANSILMNNKNNAQEVEYNQNVENVVLDQKKASSRQCYSVTQVPGSLISGSMKVLKTINPINLFENNTKKDSLVVELINNTEEKRDIPPPIETVPSDQLASSKLSPPKEPEITGEIQPHPVLNPESISNALTSEKIVGLVGLTLLGYIFGQLGFSVLWTLLVAAMYIAYVAKNRRYLDPVRHYALQMGLMENPDLLRQLLEHYPSWVQFPEYEKVLWLNRIIAKVWPYYSTAIGAVMISTINPALEKVKPSALVGELALTTFNLGEVPLIITGMKTHLTSVEEVVIDFAFEWVSSTVVKLRVSGIIVKVNNLSVSGKLRIVLGPLVEELPCVAGFSMSFIEKPMIDFRLEAVKLNVAGIPGLSDLITDILKNQLAMMLLWPKKMFIPLRELSDDEIKRRSEEMSAGVVTLTVVAARDLPRMDRFGKSDPYCIIRAGQKHFRTKVILENLNPVWNETFKIEIYDYENDKISVEVFDQDLLGSDDMIGSFDIPVRKIGDHHEHWHYLSQAKGSVLIKASYVAFSKAALPAASSDELKSEHEDHVVPEPIPNASVFVPEASQNSLENDKSLENSMSRKSSSLSMEQACHSLNKSNIFKQSSTSLSSTSNAYVFVKVLSAEQLPKSLFGINLDTYVTLQLEGQQERTKTHKRSAHPVWDEDFKLATKDLKNATLFVTVFDHNSTRSDTKLASTMIALHELPFNINLKQECELNLTNQKKKEKAKGKKPILKLKLKISPF